jgi:hypothetical protein
LKIFGSEDILKLIPNAGFGNMVAAGFSLRKRDTLEFDFANGAGISD